MNIITKTFARILLTLTFSAFAFAASNINIFEAEQNQNIFETNNAYIPEFVTDPNFRWWQPSQPVPMIPSYAMQDVAWTNGYVIFYNPQISSQVPLKVRAFILAHEYGHIYGRTSDENASDAFAAQMY